MKITGTVVDKNMNLIGLVLKGKPMEFEIQGAKDWVVTPFNIDDAKRFIKKQGCFDFELDSNDNIVSKGNKRLSDLPMYDKKGNIVNKKIQIKSAIEENGKLIGAVIFFEATGAEKRLKLSDLNYVYTYCEPVNFMLRNRNNEYYLTGKGETKKEDIPVEEKLTTKSVTQKQTKTKKNKNIYLYFEAIGLELEPIYDALNRITTLIPYFYCINTYIDFFDYNIKDRAKIYSIVYDDDFIRKYFKMIPYSTEIFKCDERVRLIKYSEGSIYYRYWDECSECDSNGCEYCQNRYECTAGMPIDLLDDLENYHIVNFDLLFNKLYNISQESDIDIYFYDNSSNSSVNLRKPKYFDGDSDIEKFILKYPNKIVANKAKKQGLKVFYSDDIEIIDEVYKDKNGVPLLKYCKPTTDYPLGYFTPLGDISHLIKTKEEC